MWHRDCEGFSNAVQLALREKTILMSSLSRIVLIQGVEVKGIRDPITYDPRPSGWCIFLDFPWFFGGMTTHNSLGLLFLYLWRVGYASNVPIRAGSLNSPPPISQKGASAPDWWPTTLGEGQFFGISDGIIYSTNSYPLLNMHPDA